MSPDALTPCITRESAAMVLTMLDKQLLVLHLESYELSVTNVIKKCNYIFCFLHKFSMTRVNGYKGVPRRYDTEINSEPIFGSILIGSVKEAVDLLPAENVNWYTSNHVLVKLTVNSLRPRDSYMCQ